MKNFLTSETDARFNEILFENRNRNYGAYVLRSEEGMILTKSLLIGVSSWNGLWKILKTSLHINSFPPDVL